MRLLPDNRLRRKEVIMFEQLNKDVKKTVKDGINTESMEFVALYDKKRGLWSEVAGKEIPVDGFFFVDGKYGKKTIVIGLGKKIELPKRYTETFLKIRDDKDMLQAVLDGKLKLTDIHEVESDNGKSAAFTLADA